MLCILWISHKNFPVDNHCDTVVITTVQLYSTKPESGSVQVQVLLAACGRLAMVRIFDWLEVELNTFHRSTIPPKQFIISIIIIIIIMLLCKSTVKTKE